MVNSCIAANCHLGHPAGQAARRRTATRQIWSRQWRL